MLTTLSLDPERPSDKVWFMADVDAGLAGKRALVTGAGQNIGAAIASELAAGGCTVLINDLDPARAQAVAAEIGHGAAPLPFDVTDHAAAKAAIADAGVDILVNNAGNAGVHGFGRIAKFVDSEPSDWAAFVDVNLYGVMSCTQAALPGMTERGWGRVITIISDAGRVGGASLAAYGAAKAGAAGFCRSVAREVAADGVTVNLISLGTMRTDAPNHCGAIRRTRRCNAR
jgi:NAD(P)-dependent dehydrogenase (short-subunit alcohol dehydrogenase family)